MNGKQLERMRSGKGFIAALDQSGGSTPKALELYGISKSAYAGEEEMFDLVHQMRTRIITSPAFSAEYVLGAILFEQTMDRKVEGMFTADYLWEKKGIVPFLKVDKGLAAEKDGVQLMNPLDSLDALLARAAERRIFGTKTRSFIGAPNAAAIEEVASQQFEYAKTICEAGLVPIIEPEVDIHSPHREESERLLKESLLRHLSLLPENHTVMLKLSIPAVDNFYADLIAHPRVLRVAALSGGYSRDEANELLAKNKGLIASFSRALTQGLTAGQSDEEFNRELGASIDNIYRASNLNF